MDEGRVTERLGAEQVTRAAELLRGGGTVAFPTETVYGLGANALDAAAVAKIFRAKERPGWDPLIVHGSDVAMLERVAVFSERARALAEAFWPGPLTLLLPRRGCVPDAVTAGRPLVGVRVPRHSLALALIAKAGVPVAAPSANRFGRTSPTAAKYVLEDLEGRIDAVLDGGPTEVGVESTVFDPEAGVIYRPGAVTGTMLESVTGVPARRYEAPAQGQRAPEAMPSPGVGIRHYAPRARLELVSGETEMKLRAAELMVAGERVGLMLPTSWEIETASETFSWGRWSDPEELARRVFAGLRELDAVGVGVIVCPLPEANGVGLAVRERLEKAARRS